MREFTNKIFNKGIYSAIDDYESIPRSAARDAQGFVTTNVGIEIMRGRILDGSLTTGLGGIEGHHFGYTKDGIAVEFRKTNTKIQYKATDGTWTDIIIGLTSGEYYTFNDYSSLAGRFVIASGHDGLYKIDVHNPESYVDIFDAEIGYKGNTLIDKGRMILWGRNDDPTGLYLSHIDEANYETVAEEALGTGDGTDDIFNGTLDIEAPETVFAVEIKAPINAGTNITDAFAQDPCHVWLEAGHGFEIGDQCYIDGVVGMTELNDNFYTVTNSFDTAIVLNLDSSGFGEYTSGGKVYKVEVLTDQGDGSLSNDEGGEGTINYTTGAYTTIFNTAPTDTKPVAATYQKEDSTDGGIADFTYTTPTRTAGEGDYFIQDKGGDPILNVIPFGGAYFSFKEHRVYQLVLSDTDLTASNTIFRENIGLPSLGAVTPTSSGIVFLNTAVPENPTLTLLRRNPIGDSFDLKSLIPQFDLTKYTFDEAVMDTFDKYVLISCKEDADFNNRIILVNLDLDSVMVAPYRANTFAREGGELYAGDSLSDNVYKIFNGWDDDGAAINAFFIGNDELFDTDRQKRVKYLWLSGFITQDQGYDIYISYDNGDFERIGEINGRGNYVDNSYSVAIGSSMVGENTVGDDIEGTQASYYLRRIKINTPKFRKRTLKFVPKGIGFMSINLIKDEHILFYNQKLPKKYRM